jgi:integrase
VVTCQHDCAVTDYRPSAKVVYRLVGLICTEHRTNDLARITFHDLRHSYATGALKAGVSPKVISERIGHGRRVLPPDIRPRAQE